MLVKRYFLEEDAYGVIWEIKRGMDRQVGKEME